MSRLFESRPFLGSILAALPFLWLLSSEPAAAMANGDPCDNSGECTSGICTDGVCCDVACGDECQHCNLPGTVGTCTNISDGQDPNNECTDQSVCDGAGACRGIADGAACDGDSDCGSGNCDDGVCCDIACDGTCQHCNLPGTVGTCIDIADGQDPNNECTVEQVCDGAGACRGIADGAACESDSDCASGNCDDGVCCDIACGGTCQHCNLPGTVGTCIDIADGQDPNNECPDEQVCDGAGACHASSNPNACNNSGDCGGGNCVDGICCDSSCSNTCEHCNLPGTEGTCTLIPDGENPGNECSSVQVCDGAGACRKLPNGEPCDSDNECTSNLCTEGICCDGYCSGDCEQCNRPGAEGTCTLTPDGEDPENDCTGDQVCDGANACRRLPNGEPCNSGNDCTSNSCRDFICCDFLCADTTCEQCNRPGAEGTCTLTPDGEDPENDCTGGQVCDGASACRKRAAGVVCSTDIQCVGSLFCSDDMVCCDSDCTGFCESCLVTGTEGACTSVPEGEDPDAECQGASVCGALSTCVAQSVKINANLSLSQLGLTYPRAGGGILSRRGEVYASGGPPAQFTLPSGLFASQTTFTGSTMFPSGTLLSGTTANVDNAAGSFTSGGGLGTLTASIGTMSSIQVKASSGSTQFGGTLAVLGSIQRQLQQIPGTTGTWLGQQGWPLGAIGTGSIMTPVSSGGAFTHQTNNSTTTTTPQLYGAIWTTGMVTVHTSSTMSPANATAFGYDNRTYSGLGTIRLVTPVAIKSDLLPNPSIGFAIIDVQFLPTPGGTAMLVAGMVALAVFARLRSRRK